MGRRYEYAGLFSKKFEDLELRGTELLTRAGKKGGDAPVQAQTFGSPLDAAQRFLARCAELEKEKFKRVFSAAPVPPLANNFALEDVLHRGSTDPHAWAVYADWVQSQGHVIGELAAIQQRGEPRVADAFLANCEEALFGPLTAHLYSAGDFKKEFGELEWSHGFLRHARLGVSWANQKLSLADQARTLLELPVARFLTRLTFGPQKLTMGNSESELIDALISSKGGQRLESLFLGDFLEPDENQMSWSGLGDISRGWELQNLKSLRLRGGETCQLGKISTASLTTFIRESGGLAASELESIVSAKWPQLKHLEIWTGDENYGAQATVELLQPILDCVGLPNLETLGLRNSQLTSELIPALAKSSLVKRLKRLDLSKGTLDAGGAQELLDLGHSFAHLQSFDLSENQIFADTLITTPSGPSNLYKLIAAEIPGIHFGEQREMDPGEDEFRFVAVGE